MHNEKSAPATSPAAAFHRFLEKLLKVSRRDIDEAFRRRGTHAGTDKQPHAQGSDPAYRSSTDSSN